MQFYLLRKKSKTFKEQNLTKLPIYLKKKPSICKHDLL